MASSVFIRHTLNALYSDLQVELRRVTVQTPKSPRPLSSSFPSDDGESGEESGNENEAGSEMARRKSREKSLFVGLNVKGIARVSGSLGEWDV